MDRLDKQTFIQWKAVENRGDSNGIKIFWSRYAIVEMVNDGLTRTEVEEALIQCEIIEDYLNEHRPLPDFLVLAKLTGSKPLRCCGH